MRSSRPDATKSLLTDRCPWRCNFFLLIKLGAKCPSPKPLGMASGRIPDKAITASSFYDHRYKPSNGRLNTKIGSCAWTSTARGRSNSWFEVDLGQMTIVTSIATQGSCTAGEWTKSYSITYYNTSSSQWVDYKESGSKKVRFRIVMIRPWFLRVFSNANLASLSLKYLIIHLKRFLLYPYYF